MSNERLLPPVYFLGALLLTALLHYVAPTVRIIPEPFHWAGIAVSVVGMAFVVLPARVFQSRGTAIKPFETSSALVQDGFFAISRNPMYLGMVLVVLGLAILLRGAVPFIVPIGLGVVLDARFIRHEERMLETTFGDSYRAYQTRVRRWL